MSTDTQAPKVKLAPDVAQAMMLAEKARKRRAKAPNTPAGQKSPIEQKNLMAEAARTYKEKGVEVPHMLFIPRKQLKSYGYDGYAPILENVDGGDTFEIQGDIMVGCSEKQYQESLGATSAKSKRNLRETVKKTVKDGGGDGETTITTSKGSTDSSKETAAESLLAEGA